MSESRPHNPRRSIKQLEVMVADTVRETDDTTTLILFTGNDRLEYLPGHFLTIDPHQFEALERFTAYLEDLKSRKEPPRAYSLCSAPHEKYLAVTVKEECYIPGVTPFPPLLSPLLVKRTPVGTRMVVTGFTGPYTMPDGIASRTDHLVHICAGSGAVPNFSMIKSAIANNLPLRHTLIYSNKHWHSAIFARLLSDLEQMWPDKLRVIHTLTREGNAQHFGPNVYSGRVSEEFLRTHIEDPCAAEFFVCGPGLTKWDKKKAKEKGADPQPRFLEVVLGALESMNIPRKQVHHETYG